MAIINTVSTAGQFRDEFQRMGRDDQFSYKALGALFEYYDELEGDTEMDAVGICCEWSEYSDLAEALEQYDVETRDDLDDMAMVIELDTGGLLISS